MIIFTDCDDQAFNYEDQIHEGIFSQGKREEQWDFHELSNQGWQNTDCFYVDNKRGNHLSEETGDSENKKNKSTEVSELMYLFQGQSVRSQHWFKIDSDWI